MQYYREMILTFLNRLTSYDYIGFVITFVLFMLLLLLALIIRKHTKTSLILVIFSFISLFAGPFLVFVLVHDILYKNHCSVETVKRLHYSNTLIIVGTLEYKGKNSASLCTIKAKVHKSTPEGFLKDLAHQLKPFKKGYVDLNESFQKDMRYNFKILIEPYEYEGDINVTLRSECFK